MEERLNIVIYADTLKDHIDLEGVPIDKTLQECIISKALVNRLGLESQYNITQSETIKDAEGKAHSVIGDVQLKWHRPGSRKTRCQKFLVADSMSDIVILSADAYPKAKGLDVHTLGLEKQTDEQKAQQAKRRQEEQAKRAKEKEAQAQREKEKQTSTSAGK